MALTLLGVPENPLSKPYCVWTTNGIAGVTVAETEPDYLRTEEPSEVAHIITLAPERTAWYFDLSGLQLDFDGFGLVNHNLSPGSLIRFIGNDITAPIEQPPNVLAASSNIVGGVINVDEDVYLPDGLQVVPSITTSNWDARFTWGDLSAVPRLGANMGQLIVRAKLNFAGISTTAKTYPKLTCDLYESGSLVRSLGWRAITSIADNGQVFVFPFNFAELVAPSGANIECKITCEPGWDAQEESELSLYATMDTLALGYEDSGVVLSMDTGWIEIPEPGSIKTPTKSIHHLLSSQWTNVRKGTFRILTDQSIHDPTIQSIFPFSIPAGLFDTLPPSYVEAGVAIGSTKFELSIGIQSEGPQTGVEVEEITGNTLGGQTYGADSFRRRVCEPTSIVVTRAEKDFLMRLFWEHGHSGAFYVILETGTTLVQQLFTSFWSTLKSLSKPRQMMLQGDGEAKYNMTIEFEEKL